MKRTVHKADEMPLDVSPVTKNGEIVFSKIHEISDIDNPTIKYIETCTPDSEDAFKVLRFLDEMNGISWTSELKRIERELRSALLDLATADNPTNKSLTVDKEK